MTRLEQSALRLLLTFIAMVLFTTAASAIPQTFVSSFGNDDNTCARSAPCRTFAGALFKTDARGEVVVLDSGEYGAFSLEKAVRITAVGVYAGVQVPKYDSPQITIRVPKTEVTVLKGLTITGGGYASNGITYDGAGLLLLEDCTISGFSEIGIWITYEAQLYLKDTVIRNNGYAGIYSIPGYSPMAMTAYGTVIVWIDHSRIEQNAAAGLIFATQDTAVVKATIRDSVISNNNGPGCVAGAFYSVTEVNVFNSEAVNNSGAGFVISGAGAKLNARHSRASNNGDAGFSAEGGGLLSATDCTAANNSFGMRSFGISEGYGYYPEKASVLSVKGCQLVNNRDSGVNVSYGAVALVSATMAAGNQFGLRNDPSNPGTLKSFGNNRVNGNTTNTAGTVTPVPQM
jgi:Right handed beta helix region